jgi:alkylation response protein AidB-like acyl-CoA dehydrogenase
MGPTLIAYGTDEQRAAFLPGILSGETTWCIGMSEPNAGSDLAGLTTAARRDGDDFVISGQKIWTSFGAVADYCYLICRTSTEERPHLGISEIVVPLSTPGIDIRPIQDMTTNRHFCEVFFDEVRVPAENLVHEEGKGWTVAKHLLGYERMGTGRIGASKRELARLKELAGEQMKDGRPLIEDARFRDRLTRVEVELMALEITNLRFLDQMRRSGRPPGADVSMLKIKGTEIQQSITELMMQAAGPLAQAFRPVDAMDFDHFTARLAPRYCNLRKATIYAGSNEIQRNIIAKATLGL